MSRKRALCLIAAIAVLAVGLYVLGTSHTPPGQAPLVSLARSNVAEFQQSFDAVTGYTRILLLVSPT